MKNDTCHNSRTDPFTNLAVLNQGTNADIISTNVGDVFLPQTPEQFTYDADGNLTSDGRWTNTWDAENRLISMTSLTNGPAGSKLRLAFGYDYMGRRISKVASNWTGTVWAATTNLTFAYDGWNMLAELTMSNSPVRAYMWGLDLSGSLQGAGGIGALLNVCYVSTAATNGFAAYDGNGNVSALVSSTDGSVIAQYEYGPFGELLRRSGPLNKLNPRRFSTKYQDDETDLLYYGYRYYDPTAGTWASNDPLGERIGNKNLRGLAANEPVSEFDSLGLVCGFCRCDQVLLGPPGGLGSRAFGPKGDTLSIGQQVPFAFVTEGAWSPGFCKCKYSDVGTSTATINGTTKTTTFGPPKDTYEVPCGEQGVDLPGIEIQLQTYPPDTLLTISLSVNITITASCLGTDGSYAEASVNISYSTKLEFKTPPPTTAPPTGK